MDQHNSSPPTQRDNRILVLPINEERAGDLQAVIDWLENTFHAAPPDDLVAARIRRKLIQEWKSHRLIHAMTLFVAWIGVGSLFLMVTAAFTGGWHFHKTK